MTRPEMLPGRVRIAADVDRPDKLLAGLTARQLALLAVPAVSLWFAYTATAAIVPLPVFAAFAAPIAVTAVIVALGRRDGLPLDRLAAAAIRQAIGPRRMVPAPDGIQPPPSWAGTDPQPTPAVLQLPALGVAQDGTVDLGEAGVARICAASAVTFSLRTPAEQQALVAGFARYLNSLSASIQILVRSQPVNLQARVAELRQAAGGLPHPALETSALAHADFLADLATTRDLLARQALVVLRAPTGVTPDGDRGAGAEASGRLARLAADTTAALFPAGITITALDGDATLACLHAAADPWGLPHPVGTCPPGLPVTAPGIWDDQHIGDDQRIWGTE
jgi:hypothetical protein